MLWLAEKYERIWDRGGRCTFALALVPNRSADEREQPERFGHMNWKMASAGCKPEIYA